MLLIFLRGEQIWTFNFVLDVYACADYIVNYISKAQKGMSELLRQACTDSRKGNSTIKKNNLEILVVNVLIMLKLVLKKLFILFCNSQCERHRDKLYL